MGDENYYTDNDIIIPPEDDEFGDYEWKMAMANEDDFEDPGHRMMADMRSQEQDIPIPDCATQLQFSQLSSETSDMRPSDAIAVFGANGKVKYIPCAPKVDFYGDEDEDDTRHKFKSGQLLNGVTISDLNDKYCERVRKRKKENESRLQFWDDSNKNKFANVSQKTTKKRSNELLVDKYRPKRFVDLTSAEVINLEVLEWFKSWDQVVFGKKKNPPAAVPGFKQEYVPDIDTRPEKKIILISGPPGVGKTTLASVVAHHCGYKALQINASMDRTANQLDEKIKVASGIGTLDGKPCCLILDEIDGIAKGSAAGVLNKLFSLTSGSWKERKKKPVQMRPVICICNNLWEKELRTLRNHSLLIKLDSIPSQKLTERLGVICHNEQIDVEKSGLMELCNISNGDIRSCLFSLQFLAQKLDVGKGNPRLTLKQVLGIGAKDRVPTWFDVMNAVFFVDDAKAALALSKMPRKKIAGKASVTYVRSLCRANPELEKVYEGCFEEYLHAKYHDYDLHKTSKLLKALSYYDVLEKTAKEKAAFGMDYMYSVESIVLFHQTCQATKLTKKRWMPPQRFSEVRKNINRSNELLDTYLGDQRRQYVTKTAMVMDYLSPLLVILSSVKDSSRKRSFHENENTEFQKVIELYVDHGFRYTEQDMTNEFTGEQTKQLMLDPNLWLLNTFQNVKKTERAKSGCDRIADEAKRKVNEGIQSMRVRKERSQINESINQLSRVDKHVEQRESDGPSKKRKTVELPSHVKNPSLSSLSKASSATPKVKQPGVKRDLFGNIIKPRAQRNSTGKKDASESAKTEGGLASHAMFDTAIGCKYEQNQGFTNAVRRRCLWQEWL